MNIKVILEVPISIIPIIKFDNILIDIAVAYIDAIRYVLFTILNSTISRSIPITIEIILVHKALLYFIFYRLSRLIFPQLSSIEWDNRLMNGKFSQKTREIDGILGTHVSRSFLRNLANSKASSLIKVLRVCLLPTLILGTSTLRSKRLARLSHNSPAS